jgi:hypothetical protein
MNKAFTNSPRRSRPIIHDFVDSLCRHWSSSTRGYCWGGPVPFEGSPYFSRCHLLQGMFRRHRPQRRYLCKGPGKAECTSVTKEHNKSIHGAQRRYSRRAQRVEPRSRSQRAQWRQSLGSLMLQSFGLARRRAQALTPCIKVDSSQAQRGATCTKWPPTYEVKSDLYCYVDLYF